MSGSLMQIYNHGKLYRVPVPVSSGIGMIGALGQYDN